MKTACRRNISRKDSRHFEDAYGLLPIPVTVTDEDRRFVWVNQACCSFYGRERGDFLGKTAACLVDGESLKRQQPAINEFNDKLGRKGYSIRRFTNHARGNNVRVVVVAFSRSMGRRRFRVGVAVTEECTDFIQPIANQLFQGEIKLDDLMKSLEKKPKYQTLLKELSLGASFKDRKSTRLNSSH